MKVVMNTGLLCLKFQRKVYIRHIFSTTGIWPEQLTLQKKVAIEQHWKEKINLADNNEPNKGEKMYILSMFPYPSGQLHLGHVRVYTLSDTFARFYRMQGKQVIHPIGWDSFGLPAENAARERNKHPAEWTKKNVQSMKEQLRRLNFSFDWKRELSTCEPSYYKWTQYLFLKLFENGLVYRKKSVVNWDPVDKTVLADEQVDAEGRSWRSGAMVEKKSLQQWFIRTSYFSEALFEGLINPSLQNWDAITSMQQGWIGECSGRTFYFDLYSNGQKLEDPLQIWTETPELLCGVSFISVSDTHFLNSPEWLSGDTSGRTKVTALNPFTGCHIPIYVSEAFEYPRATQSHLGIPCLLEEDLKFAQQYGIDVIDVIQKRDPPLLINSGKFTGMPPDIAREEISQFACKKGFGGYKSSSVLRDWLISRQRYWGTPIPVIHCPNCKVVPVPYEDLPVLLPKIPNFSKDELSPLASSKEWLQVSCPKCKGPAVRESDTMDTFVDSSWYYLRYLDPKNPSELLDPEIGSKLMPVDLYIGGLEHAVMHLFYARFMNHFCHLLGITKWKEPFHEMLVQGMVVNETYRVKSTGKYIPKDNVDFSDKKHLVEKETSLPVCVEWEKMSKSKHNGINPEDVIAEHGIDTTRLFIVAGYSPTSRYKWPSLVFDGVQSWQERIWMTVHEMLTVSPEFDASSKDFKDREDYYFEVRNLFVKKINQRFHATRQLNLIFKDMQMYLNGIRSRNRGGLSFGSQYERAVASLIIILAPLAPHFASELWSGFSAAARHSSEDYNTAKPVLQQPWPSVDMNYSLDLVVRENFAPIVKHKMPRYKLDVLTKEEAYNIAIQLKEVQASIKKWPSFKVVYTVHPAYQADLRFIPVKNMKDSFDVQTQTASMKQT